MVPLTFLALWAAMAPLALAQPSRVLYITTSAGYRHECLPATVDVLRSVCDRTRLCSLTHTEDLSGLTREGLREFDVVLFYTSGELPLTDEQRAGLLAWIHEGGSFGGFHSATDTLYSYPSYGEMIGGYFDGHPWTQSARVRNDAPEDPVTRGIPALWTLTEEYYQFRDFTPDPQVRTLLSLDTESVDLHAPGVRASNFPLAWVRPYGSGRVFYAALGHFEETWRSAAFQQLLTNALDWLIPAGRLVISPDRVGNAATLMPANVFSPGALVSVYVRGLGAGPVTVTLDGQRLPQMYRTPERLDLLVPDTVLPADAAELDVRTEDGAFDRRTVRVADLTPGIFGAIPAPGRVTLWATGLGRNPELVTARIAGAPAALLYSGVPADTPGWYRVDLVVPESAPRDGKPQSIDLTIGGSTASFAAPLQ